MMRSRLILLILVILLLSSSIFPVALKTGVRVGMFYTAYISENQGFIPLLLGKISQYTSLNFNTVTKCYESEFLINLLKEGKIDIAIGVEYTNDPDIYLIKFPIMSARCALLKKKNTGLIRRVGIVKNIGLEEAKPMFDEVLEFDSLEKAIQSLIRGKIDAIYTKSNLLTPFFVNKLDILSKPNQINTLRGFAREVESLVKDFKSSLVLSTESFKRFFFFIALRRDAPDNVKKSIENAMMKLYEDDWIEGYVSRNRLEEFLEAPNHLYFIVIEYPPYMYKEGNSWKGIDVELVRKAFHSMGYRISLKSYPPVRAFTLLKAKAVDGAFSLEFTPERMKILDFILEVPISRGIDVLFSRKDEPIDFSNLKGKKCGIVSGYAGKEYLKQLGAEVVDLKDDETGFRMLMMKRIDAILTNFLAGMYYARKLGIEDKITTSRSYRLYDSFLAFTYIPALKMIKEDVKESLKFWRYSKWYEKMLKIYGLTVNEIWYIM